MVSWILAGAVLVFGLAASLTAPAWTSACAAGAACWLTYDALAEDDDDDE